jgi:RHS repeat-associated protein
MDSLSYYNPSINANSSQSFSYNNLWQLTGISANPALISMQYVYPAGHNNGRISQSVDGVLGQTVNYTYDSLNRLSTAQATNGAWGQSYSYDGFGNLTAKTVTAGSAQQFNAAYSAATNQQVGGWYDANGNSLYGPYDPNGYRYQYYYDVENRLILVGSSDGSPGYGYGYDPQGKRVMVQTSSGTQSQYGIQYTFTFYGVTGQRLSTFGVTSGNYGVCNTGAYICADGVSGSYLYLAGKRLAQPDGYAFLTDRLGSQRDNQAYYPWGEPMGSAQTGDVEFATYWRDMVGQDYANQRYYNSNAGRFYTPDPKGMRAVNFKNPTSWNMYSYGTDDPVNRNDPSGLDDDGSCFLEGCFQSESGTDYNLSSPGGLGCGASWLSNASLDGPCGDPCSGNSLFPSVFCFYPGPAAGGGGGVSTPPQCPLDAPTGDYTVARGVVALFAPDMAADIDAAFAILNQEGIVPMITSGFRTAAAQQGVQGSPFGAAQVGTSWHQVGEAIDLNHNVSNSVWPAIVAAMTGEGLTWGGTFSHPDPVHFQNAPAGTHPSATQVAACASEHP